MPLEPPPADLAGFPSFRLRRTHELYRIHRHDREPWWFSSDGSGRFDLEGEEGTCYLARTSAGAFLEVFRRARPIAEPDVAARRLAGLAPPAGGRLADCADPRARSFGVTGAIHTEPDYELPRAWARALAAAGFVGVRYLLSHDPAQDEVGVALFGPAGRRDYAIKSDEPIPDATIAEARLRFGLVVLPARR
jgi:RES domain